MGDSGELALARSEEEAWTMDLHCQVSSLEQMMMTALPEGGLRGREEQEGKGTDRTQRVIALVADEPCLPAPARAPARQLRLVVEAVGAI